MTKLDNRDPAPTPVVRLDVTERGVAWVTLDRPEAANARNQAMREQLATIHRSLAARDDVHVVVITGGEGRHFCAGMDLKEAAADESITTKRARMRREGDVELLASLPQPTIAAINGHAIGGGLELALACDLRVVADEAKVGLPEVTHGLMPGGGGTVRLPQLVGTETALKMMYLGSLLTGAEAAEVGLVGECVPRSQLRSTVDELAEAIARQPSRALRAIKQAVRFGISQPIDASLERERDGLLWLLAARSDGA